MSKRNAPPPPQLRKHLSWSPDAHRDAAWWRRKVRHQLGRRCQSLTDDDLQELKGFIDLGFSFKPDWPDLDPKLSDTLPALGFYCAVNKQYSDIFSRSSSSSSSYFSDTNSRSSTTTIFDPEDSPAMVKRRLKQWAQVVACTVKQIKGQQN
ncbi:hypothetical protein Ddye_003649 [Dipteronia dyeriana]|uniref:Uncharacterized protein n=1 Tax=Dipteronia dyeriana TaxID=168575 RepID=A0AAD9XTG6_9ROSI|nr:hypothetical protein Ddye_003649 [Dipteronia dyeriana]